MEKAVKCTQNVLPDFVQVYSRNKKKFLPTFISIPTHCRTLLSLNAHSLLDNNPAVTAGGNLCPSDQRSASIRSPQHTFTHSWCDHFNHHDLLQLQRKNNFVCPKF